MLFAQCFGVCSPLSKQGLGGISRLLSPETQCYTNAAHPQQPLLQYHAINCPTVTV